MTKYCVFFTRNELPQPNKAHLVQVVNSANAAASLGYSVVLVYLRKGLNNLKPTDIFRPFHPRKPDEKLVNFYNIQEKLRIASLATPEFTNTTNRLIRKFTNPSTIVSKYYFPLYIRPSAKIVHTRDWNFVKTAIKYGVPAIYEHHHHEDKQFEPEIVNHPLFQIAVTVAPTVRETMIRNGMPADKVITLHNGFNDLFLLRQPEKAEAWRKKLLVSGREKLVVYSGALQRFKGVDLLIDVAKELPQVQFVLAGGEESQVQAYQQLAQEKQVDNVTFLGFVKQGELVSLLQAADVLAHPHCSGEASTFTSPLKLFDYIASGTPVVATEIPSLMEFKSLNLVAAWCEPDNPNQFARSIQYVLETYPRRIEGYPNTSIHQFSCKNRIKKIMSYVEDSLHPPLLQ